MIFIIPPSWLSCTSIFFWVRSLIYWRKQELIKEQSFSWGIAYSISKIYVGTRVHVCNNSVFLLIFNTCTCKTAVQKHWFWFYSILYYNHHIKLIVKWVFSCLKITISRLCKLSEKYEKQTARAVCKHLPFFYARWNIRFI